MKLFKLQGLGLMPAAHFNLPGRLGSTSAPYIISLGLGKAQT